MAEQSNFLKLKKFTDVDLSFISNPNTKDIPSKKDDNAIKNALKNIILTKHYERPFFSQFGSNVTNLMFDAPTPGLSSIIKKEIYELITNYEPRVDIIDILVDFQMDSLYVNLTIKFKIVNTIEPLVLNFSLKRVR